MDYVSVTGQKRSHLYDLYHVAFGPWFGNVAGLSRLGMLDKLALEPRLERGHRRDALVSLSKRGVAAETRAL